MRTETVDFLDFTHAEQVYARGPGVAYMVSTVGCFPQREKRAGRAAIWASEARFGTTLCCPPCGQLVFGLPAGRRPGFLRAGPYLHHDCAGASQRLLAPGNNRLELSFLVFCFPVAFVHDNP